MNITRLKTLRSLKYVLHFIVMITILSFGCAQKTVTDNPADVTKLNDNKTYIKLTLETNSFLQYLSETAKANSLNMPDVIKSLNNIREKNLSFDTLIIHVPHVVTQYQFDINLTNIQQYLVLYTLVAYTNFADIVAGGGLLV